MNSFHIVIAGNNETALVCAVTSKRVYPEKRVALITNNSENESIRSVHNSRFFNNCENHFALIEDEIVARNESVIILRNSDEISFEKFVIATGSEPIKSNIEGADKEGVFFFNRDPDYLFRLRENALKSENPIVFGGGYAGVVLTDEFLNLGKNVTLIERANRLLPSSIDPELSTETKNLIESQGGKVIFKSKIKQVMGDNKIKSIKLRDGEELPCDFLIICCGQKPNTSLAKKFGLVYDNDRGILVDEYHRTSDRNIFAIGECAARFDFFCGDLSDYILSTTRIEEAKLIGSNLYSVIYNRGRLIDYINKRKYFINDLENYLFDEQNYPPAIKSIIS